MSECGEDRCSKPVVARGLCGMHYRRQRRAELGETGTPREPRTHCAAGHPLTDDNVYVDKNGWRTCRQCSHNKYAKRVSGRPECQHDGCRYKATAGSDYCGIHVPRTHCRAGHPFDEENTYVSPEGQRACKACRRRREREYYYDGRR